MSTIQPVDFAEDLRRVLLWQYNDAARLQALVGAKQAWFDANVTAFWNDWYTNVFNLETANDFGLAVWAIILGVPLVVAPSTDPEDQPIWGFAADDANFLDGRFTSSSGGGFGLTTEQKRLVLRLRYFQLVTRGAVPEVNAFLAQVFGEGAVYVVDSEAMAISYVFTSAPGTAVELVLTAYDILPRPAGVKSRIVIQGEADGWGFGQYHENFGNGNFFHL